MHRQRRLARIGAVSAGTAALVLLGGAQAVHAHAAAAPAPCPKGTDPASTLDNWKCQLDNLRESLTPKQPTASPAPSPAPSKAKPAPKATPTPKPSGSGGSGGGKRTASRPGTAGGSRSGGTGAGTGTRSVPAPLTAPGGVRPYSPSTTADLPGLLPSPQVADAASGVVVPNTRLVSPAAASARDEGATMEWLAAASGAAGAAAALNVSVLARRFRRTRPVLRPRAR
ncbi:hypothetical protein [Actinomadura keratinilytica]|uniref:Uncharacterized protein n=1 Tax=Actinomadura keratinilytica TaxID=547461 RepID=A0ABP7ZFN3_9ACTN